MLSHLYREVGPGGARDRDPPRAPRAQGPHAGRARPRAGQPGHRLPQGRLPRPRGAGLRRRARRRPEEPPRPRRPAEAPRGAAAVARGLRDPDPARPDAQVRRRPRARLPAGARWAGRRSRAGRRDAAEEAFRTALSLDRRVFPAHLALAEPVARARPAPRGAHPRGRDRGRAGARLPRFRAPCRGPTPPPASPRASWRSASASSARTRATGGPASPSPASCADGGGAEEALGLLLRALEANPHVLLVHLEVWRTLRALGTLGPEEQRYVATVEESALYVDPHICTVCRYRADDMLWRCPHCHEWNTFVEERVGPGGGDAVRAARPLTLAAAAAVLAALVLRPAAHGVPGPTLASFWATVLGQVVVPGVLLCRGAALCPPGDAWLLLGQGATLGPLPPGPRDARGAGALWRRGCRRWSRSPRPRSASGWAGRPRRRREPGPRAPARPPPRCSPSRWPSPRASCSRSRPSSGWASPCPSTSSSTPASRASCATAGPCRTRGSRARPPLPPPRLRAAGRGRRPRRRPSRTLSSPWRL